MPICRITHTLTLDIPIKAILDWEHDDDGCGSPSRTGNSMTGYRGRTLVIDSVVIEATDAELASLVRKAFDSIEFEPSMFDTDPS